MITAILLFCLAFFAAYAVVQFAFSVQGTIEMKRAHDLGCEPRPGLQFMSFWDGAFGFLFLIGALLATAGLAAQQEGVWRIVPLVLINLVMQPICLFAIISGLQKVGHALHGRISYAGQITPEEKIPKEKYRLLLIERIMAGVFLVWMGGGLSFTCMWPLL